jgi:hypothetical protein
MRCTRCDRWAVPQTVGRTPDGVLVFGWCLDCMRETGCTETELAIHPRASHLPLLHELERVACPALDRDRRGPPEGRARIITLVTLVLAAWGALLLSVGGWLFLQPPEGSASPFGNGTPLLLIVGGAATTATALALGMTTFGPVLFRSRPALRSARWAGFLLALFLLVVGILDHVPQRDPYLVLAAAAALTVAGFARRLEGCRPSCPFPSNHEAAMEKEKRPNIGR